VVHTHTFGITPLGEGSARRKDHCLSTYNTHKRQTSMRPVGFEPAIPASELLLTYALECAVTRIGYEDVNYINLFDAGLRSARQLFFTQNQHSPRVAVSDILSVSPCLVLLCLTPSIHLSLALPLHLFPIGSHTRILRVSLLPGILFTFSCHRN